MNVLKEISAPYVETKGYLSLLIQINLVHNLTSRVSKSNFNIIFSCKFTTKTIFLKLKLCHKYSVNVSHFSPYDVTHRLAIFFPLWPFDSILGHGLLLTGLYDRTHWTLHSLYDSSGREISPMQRPLPDNTQHPKQTDVLAPGGIRKHNPN